MKRRKPKEQRREEQIRVRLTEAQKREIQTAATAAGLDAASWMRHVALTEARNG